MIDQKILDEYEATIGIECHVQLKTKTKLFSGVSNESKDAEPNTLISPICIGLPGVLPVLNKEAVNLALKAGHALNAEIPNFSKFDRKHYFYPDLPKGYQITQFDQPIIGKGKVVVPLEGETFEVGITRAHMEEDAGKSNHPDGVQYSLVDLNRAGTPLLEIVSEPDIHTPQQAKAYARELYLLMKYADVSDVDLYHGNMRFDVNISVAKKGSDRLGTRAEVKNLNSFRSVEAASEYEIKRQVELLEKGQEIVQETRGWDEAKQKTVSQRSKEDAHDYRYFPDPDLPPVELTDEQIEEAKTAMPKLPNQIRAELSDLGLNQSQQETIINEPKLAEIMLEVVADSDPDIARRVANWMIGEVTRIVSEADFEWGAFKVNAQNLIQLAKLVESGSLSSSGAKEVLAELIVNGGDPEEIAKSKNLVQLSDESALDKIVEAVIENNPKAIEDIRNGEMKAMGFLVGQVMKESKGAANPQIAAKLLKEKIGG